MLIEFREKDIEPVILLIKQKGKHHMFDKYIFCENARWFCNAEFVKKNWALFEKMPAPEPRVCFTCGATAVYNYKSERTGIYCEAHKLLGMVPLKKKICMHPGCIIFPAFNFDGEKKGLYCKTHKIDDMVNVVNKQCLDCGLHPVFNYPGNKTGIYCAGHKLENMENVVTKRCRTPHCDVTVTKKYEGYCARCFVYMFPERANARNYKTKEQSVADFIKVTFPNIDWRFDSRSGCSGRRPDIIADFGSHLLIVEVDENRHANYSCENKRIMEISQDFEHRPIVFIRFNPDKCSTEKSCWTINKSGICIIADPVRWSARLSKLSELINYWSKNTVKKTIEVVQLFFD